MADKPQQGFLSPLLHGSSYIRSRNIFIQDLLKMPLHHVNGNPSRNNIDQSSTNRVNSSTGADIRKDGSQPQRSNILSQSIIRGALKSVIATAMAPIERVQYLMQCQNEIIKTGRLSSPYKGMIDCFLRTTKHEGFFSLWRGNSVVVLTLFGSEALHFLVPDIRSYLKSGDPSSTAGILLGHLVQYPFLYARIRLANDVKPPTGIMHFSLDSSTARSLTNNSANNRQFNGPFDVVKKTLMCDGFGGLYRGYTFACIGIFASLHANGAIHKHFIPYFKDEQNQQNHRLLLPMIAGVCTMYAGLPLALYPLSTVSYRMMMTSGEAKMYKGAMDALYQIVRKEGVSALYKGATPHITSQLGETFATGTLLYFLPKLLLIIALKL